MNRAILAVLFGGLTGWLVSVFRGEGDGTMGGGPIDEPGAPPKPMPPEPMAPGKEAPAPIQVGSADEVASLLLELDAFLVREGVNTDWFSAAELTYLPSWGVYAVPPRSAWPRMAYTILTVAQPLRAQLDLPFYIRGYRPPAYNAAVKGASRSRHMWFEALDLYIPSDLATPTRQRALALAAARLYTSRGAQTQMGLGVYDKDGNGIPSNIHVDAGFRHRSWREAPAFIKAVSQV